MQVSILKLTIREIEKKVLHILCQIEHLPEYFLFETKDEVVSTTTYYLGQFEKDVLIFNQNSFIFYSSTE